MKNAIVSPESGDWKGLYIDGRLVYEGHEIPMHVLFKHLCHGIKIDEIECADGWLESRGNLPKDLNDVVTGE